MIQAIIFTIYIFQTARYNEEKMQSRSAKGRFQIQEEEPIMLTKSTDPAVRPSTPLAYAQSACDTMIRRYAAADLPPKGHFHYHQGVFLSGVYKTYQLCGNEAYFSYMKDWIDSVFTEDGRIKNDYKHGDLDDIQPGILLFPCWKRPAMKNTASASSLLPNSCRMSRCASAAACTIKSA